MKANESKTKTILNVVYFIPIYIYLNLGEECDCGEHGERKYPYIFLFQQQVPHAGRSGIYD